MNALANDQLDRLRDMLGGTGITFGQWVGTTPAKEGDVTVDRFPGSSRRRTWPPASSDGRRPRPRTGPCGPWPRPRSAAPRRTSASGKPRILLTNFRQLEVLTTRLPDVALFAEAPLKYLVFDEAHTYAGATGAEVACLIRRVRALAGKTPDEIICIGTSATLSDPTKKDQDNDETARRFASRFFGVDAEQGRRSSASPTSAGSGPSSGTSPSPRTATAWPASAGSWTAITEPVQIGDDQGGRRGTDRPDLRAGRRLAGVAVRPPRHATSTSTRPRRSSSTRSGSRRRPGRPRSGWRMSRLAEGDRANAELLSYLVLGAAAQKGGESLLRPKVHFFLRGLDEMVVALDGTEAAPEDEPVPVARTTPRSSTAVGTTTPSSRC